MPRRLTYENRIDQTKNSFVPLDLIYLESVPRVAKDTLILSSVHWKEEMCDPVNISTNKSLLV